MNASSDIPVSVGFTEAASFLFQNFNGDFSSRRQQACLEALPDNSLSYKGCYHGEVTDRQSGRTVSVIAHPQPPELAQVIVDAVPQRRRHRALSVRRTKKNGKTILTVHYDPQATDAICWMSVYGSLLKEIWSVDIRRNTDPHPSLPTHLAWEA